MDCFTVSMGFARFVGSPEILMEGLRVSAMVHSYCGDANSRIEVDIENDRMSTFPTNFTHHA